MQSSFPESSCYPNFVDETAQGQGAQGLWKVTGLWSPYLTRQCPV